MPPCPHFDVKIIQRSKRQSAVASAAYQSGERLFSEYDQKQKYYSHKSEIVHTEIMLPPHAPPEYADRNTLWNAVEAIEKQWNSQLARRFVLAIPRELPPEQYTDLIRDYCREFFVSKGMIADFAIHDKGDGNPHAHILLTMRAMDETGKWLPKSRKVYDLDENGERIRLASGRWKSHKEDTVDWNDQKYAEIWRQGWADTANRYLEAIDSPERLDLRSYARQGIDKIPTVHMGPAVSQLEKKGIQTNIGNLNRDIKAANSLMQSIRQMVRSLKGWLSGLKEKKAALLEALEQAKEPTIPELLSRYLDKRSEERTGWTTKGKLKGTVGDFNKVMEALDFLRQKEISTVESLDAYLDEASAQAVSIREEIRPMEKRVKEINRLLFHIGNFEANKPVYTKYAAMEPLHTATHEITFDNVDFAYVPGEPVLKHATFTVPDQKLTAIVGDSGSGKSTILNLIAKYYEATGGTISIGGKPINHVAAERVLEQVSMVDQDIFLFDDTIRDNIRHARPNATDTEIEAACREANCDSFIRKMEKGYDTPTGENGNLLSGGERQRISIARAILKNSPILLLDEATASLDIENELAVKQAIANLLKEKKTVVMIAHTLSIVKNADQILVMGDGGIAESGTHEELLAKGGKYAAMWNAEQKISA